MRVCIDLDGVIAQFRGPGQSYADVEPVAGAPEKLRELKAAGHTVILYTARHMKTCEGNVGLVVARQGKVTLDWLARWEIPFDEIYFGKPYADIYIDDNALRFSSWSEIAGDGSSLPKSAESQVKR
ncbi:MAG: capsular biosynthesis protein [Myxococcota bacterium]